MPGLPTPALTCARQCVHLQDRFPDNGGLGGSDLELDFDVDLKPREYWLDVPYEMHSWGPQQPRGGWRYPVLSAILSAPNPLPPSPHSPPSSTPSRRQMPSFGRHCTSLRPVCGRLHAWIPGSYNYGMPWYSQALRQWNKYRAREHMRCTNKATGEQRSAIHWPTV